MKQIPFIAGLVSAQLAFMAPVAAQEFTGDVKMACEALLCLSSGTRPDACAPSLARYFGIKKDDFGDTIDARHKFLKMCPASQQDDKMATLTKSISRGAGYCDAAYLNRTLTKRVQRQVCPTSNYNSYYSRDSDRCYMETITVIDNHKPNYCVTYTGHDYAYQLDVNYVGDPMNGGRWQ